MKKRISILLMIMMMLTSISSVFATGDGFTATVNGKTGTYPKAKVVIDGKNMVGDVPAVLYGDTTMVPVRFITEGIGGEVEWVQKTQEVVIRLSSKVISVKIGSREAVVDGVKKYIPSDTSSPIIMNQRTMIPLRFISENFGAEVTWESATKTAIVKTNRVGTGITPGPVTPSKTQLNTVVKQTVNGKEAIVVKNSGAVEYTHMKLENPTRVVLDIKNSALSEGEKTYAISTSVVEKVRTGNNSGVSRVVLDIKENIKLSNYSVQKSGNDIIIYTDGSQQVFYEVYQNTAYLGKFSTKDQAIAEAKKWANSTISFGGTVVWKFTENNTPSTGGKTIVIDPGHGGSDPGAISYSRKYRESDLNLSVGLKLERELKARGYNVIMTRRTDVYPTLSARAEIANRANADGFISIHFNAASPAATGLETFYTPQASSSAKSYNDRVFAESIQKEMISTLGGRDRGVKQANYTVISSTKTYAALVELGFITNPSDEARLGSDSYHELSAKALANGVDNFFKK